MIVKPLYLDDTGAFLMGRNFLKKRGIIMAKLFVLIGWLTGNILIMRKEKTQSSSI